MKVFGIKLSLVLLSGLGSFLIACQSMPTGPSISTKGLEATVSFTIDGKPYTGAATIQRKSNQKIQVNYPDGTKWGLFSTCHRVVKYKNPRSDSFWYYVPKMYLENVDSCIMLHKQIDKNGNPHYAIIDFTAGEQLLADVSCNGESAKQTGASLCQALAGTYQKISFDTPVQAYTDDKCDPPIKDSYFYTYKMTVGFCGYLFVDSKGETHRHTTYGYETLDLE